MPVQFWDRDVDTNRHAFVNARTYMDDPENAPDAEHARIPEDLAHDIDLLSQAAVTPWPARDAA